MEKDGESTDTSSEHPGKISSLAVDKDMENCPLCFEDMKLPCTYPFIGC